MQEKDLYPRIVIIARDSESMVKLQDSSYELDEILKMIPRKELLKALDRIGID